MRNRVACTKMFIALVVLYLLKIDVNGVSWMQMTSLVVEHDLMTRAEAAEYLRRKPSTLAKWACDKRYDLPFFKIGRSVCYKRTDLDQWLESRRVGGVVSKC